VCLELFIGEWSPLADLEAHSRLVKRALVSELTVETMIVADSTMVDQHGTVNLEAYLFTLMGLVRNNIPATAK